MPHLKTHKTSGKIRAKCNELQFFFIKLLELFVVSLKDGCNHQFDPSLRKLYSKSLLARYTLELI